MSEEPKGRDPMWLWKRVAQTNPKYAKEVKLGRKFTAVQPQSQIMEATRVFGPMGSGWGPTNVRDELVAVPGTPEVLVKVTLDLFYVDPETGERGLVEHVFGSAALIAQNKDGRLRTDDDAWKKARTDAMTKALSQIGFNADVFLGMWDNHKYVAQREREVAEEARAKRAPSGAQQPATPGPRGRELMPDPRPELPPRPPAQVPPRGRQAPEFMS